MSMTVLPVSICHRIIERFELEGIPKGHPVPLPCREQGHLPPGEVALSLVQPDLECPSGHPPPLWARCSGASPPFCQKLLPYIPSKSSLLPFETISPSPIPTDPAQDFRKQRAQCSMKMCPAADNQREQQGLLECCVSPVAVFSSRTGFTWSLYPDHHPQYAASPQEASLVCRHQRKKTLCHLLTRARKVKQLPVLFPGTGNQLEMGNPLLTISQGL